MHTVCGLSAPLSATKGGPTNTSPSSVTAGFAVKSPQPGDFPPPPPRWSSEEDPDSPPPPPPRKCRSPPTPPRKCRSGLLPGAPPTAAPILPVATTSAVVDYTSPLDYTMDHTSPMGYTAEHDPEPAGAFDFLGGPATAEEYRLGVVGEEQLYAWSHPEERLPAWEPAGGFGLPQLVHRLSGFGQAAGGFVTEAVTDGLAVTGDFVTGKAFMSGALCATTRKPMRRGVPRTLTPPLEDAASTVPTHPYSLYDMEQPRASAMCDASTQTAEMATQTEPPSPALATGLPVGVPIAIARLSEGLTQGKVRWRRRSPHTPGPLPPNTVNGLPAPFFTVPIAPTTAEVMKMGGGLMGGLSEAAATVAAALQEEAESESWRSVSSNASDKVNDDQVNRDASLPRLRKSYRRDDKVNRDATPPQLRRSRHKAAVKAQADWLELNENKALQAMHMHDWHDPLHELKQLQTTKSDLDEDSNSNSCPSEKDDDLTSSSANSTNSPNAHPTVHGASALAPIWREALLSRRQQASGGKTEGKSRLEIEAHRAGERRRMSDPGPPLTPTTITGQNSPEGQSSPKGIHGRQNSFERWRQRARRLARSTSDGVEHLMSAGSIVGAARAAGGSARARRYSAPANAEAIHRSRIAKEQLSV